MKNLKVSITLGLLCCILTLAISIQLKTIDNARESANSTVSLTLTSNELRDQVLKWKEKYEVATKELDKSEKNLENVRIQSTQNDETAIQKEEQIKQDNILLGLTDVEGKGIIIKLEDDTSVSQANLNENDNIEFYLVHAGDLVRVINDLKNAGAEAISVNGQRIVTSSSIYCAGNVIKVNNEKIGSPIEIKAIGDPELLYGSLTIPGGYIQLLQDTGVIVHLKKSNDIKINKYDGIISAENMKNE